MKKTYAEPELQVVTFSSEDILMTSNDFDGTGGPNELPIVP